MGDPPWYAPPPLTHTLTLSNSHPHIPLAHSPFLEILPKSYYEFIKFAGPLDTTALEALRRNANDVPLDVELITAHCAKRGGVFDPPLTPIPRTIPCTIMHPHTRWCALFWVQAFLGSASRTLPFYAAFLFLPSLALQASRLLRTPLQVIHKCVPLSLSRPSLLPPPLCSQLLMIGRD